MKHDLADKLKKIDDEISNALDTISELEKNLTTVRTDEEGHILKDECASIRDKFESVNKSVQELTRLLVESGILDENDIE